MKKTGFHKAKLFIAVLLFSLVAIFMFQGNALLEMCSKLFVKAETIENGNGATTFASQEIEGFNSTYKLNGSATSETSLTKVYDGEETVLSVDVSATTATNFNYQWCIVDETASFVILKEETNSSISISNVSESGNYYCIVTNADNTEEASVTNYFNVTITQKELFITTLRAVDKEYDGTKEVSLYTKDTLDVVQGDIVELTGVGSTSTAIADQNKLVTVESVKLFGEDAENYKVNLTNLSNENIFVNINKKAITFSWGTSKTLFTYNGKDQILNIAPYYLNHVRERIDLKFSITGYNLDANLRYVDEFVNAGTYEAVIILTDKEANYELADKAEGGDKKLTLIMNRADSVISVKNTVFVYTGSQQDAGRCAYLNNNEQTLTFENNLFTTVKEGKSLNVVARAAKSLNYWDVEYSYSIEVLKATAIIDVSGVKKDYVYTGSLQKINSGATIYILGENGERIENNEQTLSYTNNTFTTVKQGNNLEVKVSALYSDNFNSTSTKFKINVSKADIDTSKWYWHYIENITYTGSTHSVELVCDANLVSVSYTDATKKDAGVYVAKAKLTLNDENYNPVTFEDLVWEIKKANLVKPNCEKVSTVYSGEVQTLNVPTSIYYTTENTSQINAGTYQVIFTINQPKNYQWNDGTIGSLTKLWTIEKQVVAVPQIENEFFYDGESKTIALNDTNLYSVIKESKTEVGEYSAYLVLKDSVNYKWADEYGSVATVTWKILPKENPSTVPMLVIISSCILLLLISVIVTLHSTSTIKQRRKERIAKKELKGKSEAEIEEIKKVRDAEKPKTNKTVTASTKIIRRKPKTATSKTVKPKKEKEPKKKKVVKKESKSSKEEASK